MVYIEHVMNKISLIMFMFDQAFLFGTGFDVFP